MSYVVAVDDGSGVGGGDNSLIKSQVNSRVLTNLYL